MMRIENALVVIPARGGSRRIPQKNIREIYGQPMIYWPLMELSSIFSAEAVLVSTDSDDVASKVRGKGLKVPFRRPAELSDDHAGTAEVVTHALNWYELNVKRVDYVVTVYPTAVMLSVDDIVSAIKLLESDAQCDFVMSATRFPFPIQRAVFQNSNGYAEMFQPEHYTSRSQDLIEAMHDAGQFYVNKSAAVRDGKVLTNSNVKLHPLHRNRIVDIDTVEDFELAEEKLQLYKSSHYNKDWKFNSRE